MLTLFPALRCEMLKQYSKRMRRNKNGGEKMKRDDEEAAQKEDEAIIMNNSIVKNNGDTSFRLYYIRLCNCKDVNNAPYEE